MVNIYQTHASIDHDAIVALMNAETWMNEYEALNNGFVDEVDYSSDEKDSKSESESSTEATDSADSYYAAGVKAERERLRALDELYTPGRAKILNTAKYQTGQTAQEIALELLKAEAKNTPKAGVTLPIVNNFSVRNENSELDAFIDAVNRKKGK